MVDRRLKALTTIRRLADQRLEEDATALTALRGQIATLQTRKARLRYKAAHEGHITTPESAPYVARFLVSVRAEEVQLDTEIARLSELAAGHEAVVRARFQEAKKLFHVETERRQAHRDQVDAKERQVLDDSTVMRFRQAGMGSRARTMP